jgi:Sulfotransferase family
MLQYHHTRAKKHMAQCCICIGLSVLLLSIWSEQNRVTSGVSQVHDTMNLPTNFEGVKARAFKTIDREIPCFPAEPDWINKHNHYTEKGFVFVKPYKTGSSTASGVNLRLARNIAGRLNISEGMCLSRSDHTSRNYNNESTFPYRNLNATESFLWTIIRNPTKRIVSAFFHFVVSRGKKEPTDKVFSKFIDKARSSYYLSELSSFDYKSNDPISSANKILDRYDFIGVTERMDESFVVLAMILGVPISDVLYLNAKISGGFDDGSGGNPEEGHICTYLVPSFLSRGMAHRLDSEDWKNKSHWDEVLYKAVNVSLDLTIDRLGRERVANNVLLYKAALRKSHEVCKTKTIMPCSEGGVYTPDTETDCLMYDSSCGNKCIDEVAMGINLINKVTY